MARLPIPGGDDGDWGNILNDFLSQSHNPDGSLKDNIVSSNVIAPNAVTTTKIVNGTVTEAQLSGAVQTKLNETSDWTTLANKPAVIASGSTQEEARDTIGAVDQAFVAAWAEADAYIDFEDKANGDPPSVLDTGQTVDFIYGPSNWKPQVVAGKLDHGPLPASGNYADYYQAQLDDDCHTFGTHFTVDVNDGSTQGVFCIAVWAGIYQTTGTVVPTSPAHITIDTTTGAWGWWVNGPGGSVGTSYLKAAKTGSFSMPASDGVTVWECAAYIDADHGIAYLYLPGNDAVTGSRIVTVTDAEIAAAMTAQSVPVTTLAATLSGANVLMIEHQANSNANTARYPRFLDMWGQTRKLPRDRARALHSIATMPVHSTGVQYVPSAQQAKTLGTSNTIIYTDTGNTIAATISATAGPTGKIEFVASACIEFGGSTSRLVTDGAISAASTTLTSATAVFTTDDIGRQVTIAAAGPSGSNLVTTIASRTNSTTVVLSDAATTTVASGGSVRIYLPTETIVYARMSATGASTTPTPECFHRGRAGERWTGDITLVATGLTPGEVKTWTLSMQRFPFGDGTATLKFGGSTTVVYPSLKIKATPL